MNAIEENKTEKRVGTHLPPQIHIGREIVNMLLGLITEMETFDQSLKGGKGENYSNTA